ncbi:MAG: hypothetical protein R3F14_03975 [Polyangiaceae bacterium]
MANLLGDLWADREPDWQAACAFPDVKLHLYGKLAARPAERWGTSPRSRARPKRPSAP